MRIKTKRILLSASLAFCCSVAGWAQDVFVDFVKEGTANSNRQTLIKDGNVSFDFVASGYEPFGAYFYKDWNTYQMTITSPRPIAVIEYQIAIKSSKTADLGASTGTISTKDAETRVWRGSASTIKFVGNSDYTNFSISRLRLWFNAADYNPDVSWDAAENTKNPYEANVNLAEDDTDYSQKDRLYVPVNVLPRDGHGVPMAVVSNRKFQQTLQPYLEWKTQQGYEVQELYTDQLPGKRGAELAHAIRERLMAMDPRPAYVLLVGDVDEVPSFPGSGPADLYYGEYTDDYYADAYVGRFSASNVEQLQPQLDKTRYMAFLSPNEGEWLKHSLTVDDITPEISVMDPAAALSLNYPLNFEDNTSQKTETTWSESINTIINNGCSYVSYFGHGGPGMWNGNYSNSNVNSLNNRNKYPVVFSITCHAGNFAFSQPCLAEAFMQRKEAGAVAVIAASRPSRSDSNYRLFFGENMSNQTTGIGMLRSLFPCVGADPSQRARTIGQALEVGMLAVARKIRDDFYDNTEMYNLLGDPTYQPYITTPKANKLSSSSYNIKAGQNVTVTTVPDAMVCLSKGRTVIAAAMAGTDGKAVLHVPAATTLSGDCTLYTSAPGYNDLSRIVTLSAGNGTEEQLDGTTKAEPRITHTDVISLATAGGAISKEWNGQQTIASSTSSARYLICAVNEQSTYADEITGYRHWLNTSAPAEGIFLRNKYDYCSLVTTSSPGKARRVSIDWLHPTGQGEVIGVYGSNTPYTSTDEAWPNAQGKKLGELVKGCNDELIIDGDCSYLLFRAEPSRELGAAEQVNVYIKSLTIGWEANLPQCAKPQIALEDGKFRFNCSTPNATYNYGVAPAQTARPLGDEGDACSSKKFVLTVTAEADGYKPSAAATLTFDGRELAKLSGDLDANGTLSITDVVKLINTLSPKK